MPGTYATDTRLILPVALWQTGKQIHLNELWPKCLFVVPLEEASHVGMQTICEHSWVLPTLVSCGVGPAKVGRSKPLDPSTDANPVIHNSSS